MVTFSQACAEEVKAEMGFEIKIRLVVAMAIVKVIQTTCTVILAAGDINTIILIEAIANGVLMGISYYKQK